LLSRYGARIHAEKSQLRALQARGYESYMLLAASVTFSTHISELLSLIRFVGLFVGRLVD
jgi:hypothetical protein